MEDRLVMSAAPTSHDLLAAALIEGMSRPRPKPKAPSFTATAISTTQVKLSWTKAPSASKYLIEYWSNGRWVKIGTMSKKTTACTVNGLQPNTTYFFDVCYVIGRRTYWETVKSAHTLPPPTPPCPWVVDHPGAAGTYTVVAGTLFGPNGPEYTDVHQGNLGDCWLLASLAEAAARAPQDIQRMFTDIGIYMENGVQTHLWSVHFYNASGALTSVIVDNELPVDANNSTVYDQVSGNVLWVALAEKAYVEAAAAGYVHVNNTAYNTYNNIDSGLANWALGAITGHVATPVVNNANDVNAEMTMDGDLVVVGNACPTASSLIEPNHAYAVIADTGAGGNQFTIFNPWNAGAYHVDPRGVTVFGGVFYCSTDFLQENWAWQFYAQA